MPNYIQPGTGNPPANPQVGVGGLLAYNSVATYSSTTNHITPNTSNPGPNVHGANFSVGRNPMQLVWPLPKYVQPISAKEFPSGKT